jgi:hypothetical protein
MVRRGIVAGLRGNGIIRSGRVHDPVAQGEAIGEPDPVADDVARKAMVLVTFGVCGWSHAWLPILGVDRLWRGHHQVIMSWVRKQSQYVDKTGDRATLKFELPNSNSQLPTSARCLGVGNWEWGVAHDSPKGGGMPKATYAFRSCDSGASLRARSRNQHPSALRTDPSRAFRRATCTITFVRALRTAS